MQINVSKEFDELELGDRRRARRVQKVVERLSTRPDQSFPDALGDDNATDAFYRLVGMKEVTFEKLNEPHRRETVARAAERRLVLVAHDTTDFSFKGDGRKGLGTVNHSGQGFYGHFSIAVSADGRREPLGTLAVKRWVRTERAVSTRVRAGELTTSEARKEKRESSRWGEAVQEVEHALSETGTTAVHIMDSEADDFTLLYELAARSRRFVVRGYHDRKMIEAIDGASRVKEFGATLPVSFERYVGLSKRKTRMFDDRKRTQKRAPRTAHLAFSANEIRLKRPKNVEKELPSELTLNVVYVREIDPPPGDEPIDWTLLTREPIDTDDEISRIVDFYRARWVIEEFFKALKTGCAFEKRQLESLHTLENALALLLPIAWALLRLRSLARDYPDLEASSALKPLEITVLHRMKLLEADTVPTMRQALMAIAKLGGHLKHNGEPGWNVLGRGYQELVAMAAGFALSLPN